MPARLRCLAPALLVFIAGCASNPEYVKPRGSQGGFTVLVDQYGGPTATQVSADIGEAALNHGFTRLPARTGPPADPVTREALPKAPERYGRNSLELEVSYQPATHRVTAYLHDPSTTGERKFIRSFYADYHKTYAPRYGKDPISESAYSDDVQRGGNTGPDIAPGIGNTRTTGLSGGGGY